MDALGLRARLYKLAKQGEAYIKELDTVDGDDAESIIDIGIDIQDVMQESAAEGARDAEDRGQSEQAVHRARARARGVNASTMVRTVGLLPVLSRITQQEAKLVALMHPWARVPGGTAAARAAAGATTEEQQEAMLLSCDCLVVLLRVLFDLVRDSVDVQELACVVGAVDPISRMMDPVIPLSVRRECAAIAHVLAHSKKSILQLLVTSGGVQAFVRLLHPGVVLDPLMQEDE